MKRQQVMMDGNEAVAYTAYRLNEIIAIYPITPSTPMGEHSDAWSAKGISNIWGTVPLVMEMQAEGGAAGAVHGALTTGSLTTTFTASQGLLLMIPNMYKIAGELTPAVFHVAARSVAAQALSIFGDHSDVTAARATGFAMLASRSIQEAHDVALIAQAASLESRIPFVHFFDGFRTSHEVNKIELLDEEVMKEMIDDELVFEHRARGLSADHPSIRGTAQNPDVFFQARESVNPFYDKTPEITQRAMDKFAKLTGREYHLFEYAGAPDAERIIVLMASGAQTAEETAKFMAAQGEKVGVITVRLYRPFAVENFLQALPKTTKAIAVLDRTKEPGADGEPLYKDVASVVLESIKNSTAPFEGQPVVVGGRFGLSSKEFNPGMVKGVFDELKKETPLNSFSVGIEDDLTHKSISYDPSYEIEGTDIVRCVFFGLGSDGTVGANKNSTKIIGEETGNYSQGYFVYDSKKSGAMTISHLRFGPKPIKYPYLIGENKADFVACHQFSFLEKYDMLKYAKPGSVFLLNSMFDKDTVWENLPIEVQTDIIKKKLKFYIIDAYDVAEKTKMGVRINTIMQTCFFSISGVLPKDEAIEEIKKYIKKTYGKRGEAVVAQNFAAVDSSVENLYQMEVPEKVSSTTKRLSAVPENAPAFVKEVLGVIIGKDGDSLPVSKLPNDGTYPTGTTQWEKRNIALEVPVWESDLCIQCGKCAFVCPHAVIRTKVYDAKLLENAPSTFKSIDAKFKEFPGAMFTVQISPEDCTGCGMCVQNCPAKDKTNPARKAINMAPQPPLREKESENWEFFFGLPDPDRTAFESNSVKNSQLLRPLFEFSGACAGCGETPYVKLLTQLFGDRTVIANATGCSSIYGGNLPTTPYTFNNDGRGPAWSNSLFEDNAEFGLGMRLTTDRQIAFSKELVKRLSASIGSELTEGLLTADQTNEAGIQTQRGRVVELKKKLNELKESEAKQLLSLADMLVRKSIWIVGGDGWAYDIGYGGLDHVLASGYNVNVLVLDTGVYSNTGGQSSKATPRGAVAKFAANGKSLPRKDLGMIAMTYGYIYTAQVAMGASDIQTLRAFKEADAYDGPSLIIAYTHCINHGYDMKLGLNQQQLAVKSGVWPIYRFNPENIKEGKNPLKLDYKEPSVPVKDFAYNETRYKMLVQTDEERAKMLMGLAQSDATERWMKYSQMAAVDYSHMKSSE
jgi:pyruvate-ferredoxin/flavodoxin oxidoreductase